ncbi:unannotated protein [freshwater metagenome]|uniref:Unannotated protein n=1 Tax=freshwater metagenome TaxID=449393 RepID=A0A6J6ELZ6_9ZZZZ
MISGVLGIGASGPIIAKSLMPVPTMIMWRNLLGGLVMLPFALKRKEWQTSAQRNAIKWSAISGVLLALHFICFFLAMRMTSVATGTALTATQPIFAALFIKLSGGHIPRRAWSGMFIAFASVLLITGVDLSMSLRSFQGDLLAVIGGALAALYIIIGSNVQRNISTSTFTTVCYLSCAVTALPVAVIGGFDLIGFSNYEWFLLIALVLTAQIMGHTMFNLTLKRVSPAIVGLVVFFEVPVSAILAYFWLDQTPPAGTIPGIIGLLIGCGFFVVRSKQ